MLGRHHLSISVASMVPFVIPLFIIENSGLVPYAIAFLIAVAIGSLIPDADCGGKPSLYYDFKIVYKIMIPITSFIIWVFKHFNFKEKFNLMYEVDNEHRGIMHSPIGIAVSSFLLMIILTLITILIMDFNILFIFTFFLGVFIGQFLHILEDSMTVSGINWKFPFGDKILNGKIYTFEKFENKVDIRPIIFQYSFIILCAVVFACVVMFQVITSLFIVYLLLFLLILLIWLLFFKIAESPSQNWYRDKNDVRSVIKQIRRFN